jgi:hypothetical protein
VLERSTTPASIPPITAAVISSRSRARAQPGVQIYTNNYKTKYGPGGGLGTYGSVGLDNYEAPPYSGETVNAGAKVHEWSRPGRPPIGGLLAVCRACSTARRCKSSSQRDGREVIAKRKGEITLVARRGLKEAWSKDASR